jgi:hypothetical protein
MICALILIKIKPFSSPIPFFFSFLPLTMIQNSPLQKAKNETENKNEIFTKFFPLLNIQNYFSLMM